MCSRDTYLLGPFNFIKKDSSTPAHSIIAEQIWINLSEICEARSILPPIVGPNSDEIAVNTYRIRQQLKLANGIDTKSCISSLDFTKYILKI